MVGYWSFQACLRAENIDIWKSNKSVFIWPVYTRCCGAADLKSKWKKDIGSLDAPMFYFFTHGGLYLYLSFFFSSLLHICTSPLLAITELIPLQFSGLQNGSKHDNPGKHISLNVALCLMWNPQQQLWQVSHFRLFHLQRIRWRLLGN